MANRSVQLHPPHRVSQVQYGAEAETRSFDVDFVFTPTDTNEQLCASALFPLMDRVLDGFHALIASYGSSGTGKGHTFQGTGDDRGVILSSAAYLFRTLAKTPSAKSFFMLSAYQIQHNAVVDLLAPNTLTALAVVDHRQHGATVDGVSSLAVADERELSTLIAQVRATSSALSQRGGGRKPHVVIEWRVDVQRDGGTRQSLVRWVQCAGSGGASLKFNPGLTALSSVANALAQGKEPWSVPFASSSLTRLMQFALSGGGHALFVVCIDETDASHEDTSHSLHLASLLSKVALSPKPNRSRTSEQLAEVREEIAQVRGRLGLQVTGEWSSGVDVRDVAALKRLVDELERVKADTWPRRLKECERWRKVRVERLQKEGLAHVLLDYTEVPQSMRDASDALLRDIIQLRSSLDEVEREAEHIRAEGVDDDPRAKDAAEREADTRARLDGVETEHRALVASIAAIEADQRRVWAGRGDDAALARYNRTQSWSHLRQAMVTDAALTAQVASLDESAALIAQSFQGKLSGAVSAEAIASVASDAAALTAEWLAVSRQSAVAGWERDRLYARLIEERVRADVEREREREEALQLLAEYRAAVEEEKRAMEERYRAMLSESVKDALRWSEESARVQQQLDDQRRRV